MITREAFNSVSDELERYDCLLHASEGWGESYGKDESTHAKIIRNEAAMAKALRGYFRGLADKAENYINWNAFYQVKAYDIDVVVNDYQDTTDTQQFISVTFDYVAAATATGALAGENIYKIKIGLSNTDAVIQALTTKQIAFLVGKKVDKNGQLIDNPNAKYSITKTTRENIRKSIQTSIAQGEDKAQAVTRLQKTLNNPLRAANIAQTETVNAYGNGLVEFGRQTGAVGKASESVGAIDVCAEYAELGPVPLNHLYGGQFLCPAYHVNCRCSQRLIYPGQDEAKDIKL